LSLFENSSGLRSPYAAQRETVRADQGSLTVRTATIPDLRSVTSCRSAPGTRARSQFSLLMESEAKLYDFVLTRFLHANRHPSSGQAQGHALLENAVVLVLWLIRQGFFP
jgi:hypothetical protein